MENISQCGAKIHKVDEKWKREIERQQEEAEREKREAETGIEVPNWPTRKPAEVEK